MTPLHPGPPNLICYWGKKGILKDKFFTATQDGYEGNPEIYKQALNTIEEVTSYIHENLSGYELAPSQLSTYVPMKIDEYGEVLQVLKAGRSQGSQNPDDYNYLSCVKMKYYGPTDVGYLPSIDDDLSGQFFPCENIEPYSGRMDVSVFYKGQED